jgi:hypothetical protein
MHSHRTSFAYQDGAGYVRVRVGSTLSGGLDLPLTTEDLAKYAERQHDFSVSFKRVFDDDNAPRTVVIVPSLSLDQQIMQRISGVHHYEERMLCLLLLLRLPRTRVIYLTSTPIAESIVDYYLQLLPGIPASHARRRLTLLACHDASAVPLTQKILTRRHLIERLRQAIGDPSSAHMSCFTVSELERRLALALEIPIYGCDPSLLYWGTKSGSRRIFREADIDAPLGYEDLSSKDDIARALAELKSEKPELQKAVVKMNDGFSGEGNAIFDMRGAPTGRDCATWIRDKLPEMAFEAHGITWDLYEDKFQTMGGIVEEFIPGEIKESPSVQLRVDPNGKLEVISTHDQVLGGANGQIFLGCRFPASSAYRLDIQDRGLRAAQVLASKGVLGRFGIDFISVREPSGWRHVAIEVNLRKGGTTHPFLMLQFLTDGRYDAQSGAFLTPSGQSCCYFASDNLESERYRGLTPDDLIDIAVFNKLHFHAATGAGVVFHLIGALSEFGKFGVLCIDKDPAGAEVLYRRTIGVFDREGSDRDPSVS